MKKIFAILLVLVLSLSMITPVFAARDYDYDYNDYSYTDNDIATMAAAGSILALIAGFGILGSVISLAIAVLTVIAMWKIFVKAGEEGWKAIIPVYNAIILFKIVGLSPWLLFICLAAIIPVIGMLAVAVLFIIAYVKLAQAFGKSGGFAVGLVLLNTIFIMILGFGDAQYVGNGSTVNDTFYADNDNNSDDNNDEK